MAVLEVQQLTVELREGSHVSGVQDHLAKDRDAGLRAHPYSFVDRVQDESKTAPPSKWPQDSAPAGRAGRRPANA